MKNLKADSNYNDLVKLLHASQSCDLIENHVGDGIYYGILDKAVGNQITPTSMDNRTAIDDWVTAVCAGKKCQN